MSNLQFLIDKLLQLDPFDLEKNQKKYILIEIFKKQINYHFNNCQKYKKWYLANNFINYKNIKEYKDIPFIPSKVFKLTNLISSKKYKKIQSSGTTSSLKSTIFIDKQTSINQTKSLSKILSYIIGKKRKNYYIVDVEPNKNSNNNIMSARQAGMLGYLMGAKNKTYLLKLNNENKIIVNNENLNKLKTLPKSESVIIIGYTYMIYQYLLNNKLINFDNIALENQHKLIHFGGWKKVIENNISKNEFTKIVNKQLKISIDNIFDIYGFTEQLGTIYVSSGYRGCKVSNYSHVLVRDPITLEEVENGKIGFLQFLSPLPLSYPGFSILNDDLGMITNKSSKININNNLEFIVNPRTDNAEDRGCGDTLPENYYI